MGETPFERKFKPAQREEYLKNIRAGMRRGAAADSLGFARIDVREYIDRHPEFERLVLDAEIDQNEHVEEALYQGAISGNVTAARHWLELRGGGRQRPAQEPTGPTPPQGGDGDDVLFGGNVTPMDPRLRKAR